MSNLRKVLSICLVLSFIVFPINLKQASALTPELNTADLEAFLDRVIGAQMDELNIPNLTVSVVAEGEVILSKGYGYADMEKKTPVDADRHMFRIGSTSKLFTWTAIMQLVEQGKLDLDTDVNEYLDFAIPSMLEYGSKKEVGPITIRNLMNHTPGFEDYMTDVFNLVEEDMITLEEYVKSRRPARVFPPGEVTAYSNYGTSLAGYIVEVVSGIPFEQYIEENIYVQLGMEHSTFRQPLPAHLAPHMSKPYRYVNGDFAEAKFELFSAPAGSMTSSATDMTRFMLAYLNGGQLNGKRILEETTVERMFKGESRQHPSINGMTHGFIKETYNDREIFHHPGGTMLYITGMYLLPEEEVGFFISHSGGNFLVNTEIFYEFMDRYFPAKNDTFIPQPTEGMKERSMQFVGEYHQNRKSFTTLDKLLSLMIGVIRVDMDEEGYLLVNHLMETSRFVEVEPGVYQNTTENSIHEYSGEFKTIAFGTDSMGRTMLMASGPMSYSRAPWYESSIFTFAMLGLSILFIIGSLIYWGAKALVVRFRNKQVPIVSNSVKWAKRVVFVNGILTLIIIMSLLSGGGPDPVYGLPPSAYTPPSTLDTFLDLVPYGFVLITLPLLVFTFKAWKNGYWKAASCVHYSIFALASVILSWIFYNWNVI